jgi:hypothetical protein
MEYIARPTAKQQSSINDWLMPLYNIPQHPQPHIEREKRVGTMKAAYAHVGISPSILSRLLVWKVMNIPSHDEIMT